jgi:hypothetical protein
MGTCDLKWIWKHWNEEAFYWKIFEGEYDLKDVVNLIKTDVGVFCETQDCEATAPQ